MCAVVSPQSLSDVSPLIPLPPDSNPTPGDSQSERVAIAVGVVVGVCLACVAGVSVFMWLRRKRMMSHDAMEEQQAALMLEERQSQTPSPDTQSPAREDTLSPATV